MRHKVSSGWLPSYIKAVRQVLQTFKMDGYFPDNPHRASPTYTLSNECKWLASFMSWLLYHWRNSSWAVSHNEVVEWNQRPRIPSMAMCVMWLDTQNVPYTYPPRTSTWLEAGQWKISEWSQTLSLDFQVVFLWSVSTCHKTPNHLMTEKVTAAKIFLSFKCLTGVTEHKHRTDNNAIISKDTGRREKNFFLKNYAKICVIQSS